MDKESILQELMQVRGIKQKTAEEFYNLGARSLADLKKLPLTKSQQAGLKYLKDLQQKIPRKEIDDFNNYLQSIINPAVLAIICGSYRRGKNESSDIDILVTTKDENNHIDELLERLIEDGYLIEELARGPINFEGLLLFKKIVRKLDIFFAPTDKFYFALRHYTGSDKLNRHMSTIAIEKDFKLSKNGLVHRSFPAKLFVHNETQIFKFLGMQYLAPPERNFPFDIKTLDITCNTFLITDIDGTIANINERLERAKKFTDEKKFYSYLFDGKNFDLDIPITQIRSLINSFPGTIVYISGRPRSTISYTRTWLKKHNFRDGMLLQRPQFKKTFDFKREKIESFLNDGVDIWCYFGDELVDHEICDLFQLPFLQVG